MNSSIVSENHILTFIPIWDTTLADDGNCKKILRDFWNTYPESKVTLQEWYVETEASKWDTPNCIKQEVDMNIRPIHNQQDYEFALEELASLMDAEFNTPEGDMLDILATLVDTYEKQHFPIYKLLQTEKVIA